MRVESRERANSIKIGIFGRVNWNFKTSHMQTLILKNFTGTYFPFFFIDFFGFESLEFAKSDIPQISEIV